MDRPIRIKREITQDEAQSALFDRRFLGPNKIDIVKVTNRDPKTVKHYFVFDGADKQSLYFRIDPNHEPLDMHPCNVDKLIGIITEQAIYIGTDAYDDEPAIYVE